MRPSLIQAIEWAIRRAGLLNLVTFILLYLSVTCLVLGLRSAMKGLEAWPLLAFGLAGLILGWLLAGSARRGGLVAAITFVSGGAASLLVLGRLGQPLGLLARAEAAWIWQALHLKRLDLGSLASLDQQPILQAWQGLNLALNNLAGRSASWVQSLSNGRPAYDPLIILIGWAFVLWLVAAWAGWWVRGGEKYRERVLIGLLPSGVILAGYVAYAGAPVYSIAIWLGVLVALQALGDYRKHIHHWQASRVDKAEIELEWSLAVLAIIACLVTFSLATPAFSIPKIAVVVRQALNPAGQQEVARALGLKDSRLVSSSALERVQNPGLPTRHLLGAGPELSERIVMWVNLEGYQPGEAESHSFYWRSLTYEQYTGRGWSATPRSRESYPGGEGLLQQLTTIATAPYEVLQARIQMANPLSKMKNPNDPGSPTRLLYHTGELLGASQPYQVAWRSPGDIFGASIMTDTFSVTSRLVRPSEGQLRLAGQAYPEDIRRSYLGLPESVPRRVWDLALELTVAEPTPYDQALAIENYLRAFPYTLDLKAPPADRDIVDYFLFDLKRGYCDYYASAMVVLARAAGLPARLVIGYGSGAYRPEEARFVVTEADAHAWAEIYFPGYGWVEFEPTASRPAVWRPSYPGQEAQLGAVEPQPESRPAGFGSAWRQLRWVAVALAAIALLILLGGALDRLRLGWLPPERVIFILYRRLYRRARQRGTILPASTTPGEFADQLTGRLNPHIDQPAHLQTHIVNLADHYAESVYSAHSLGAAEKQSSLASWDAIRHDLLRARLAQILHRGKFIPPPQEGQP